MLQMKKLSVALALYGAAALNAHAADIKVGIALDLSGPFSALDAKPVTLPFMSLYGSLKKNEVEAQENPLDIVKSKKLYEVQKYVLLTAHVYDTLGVVIGKAAWGKLTPQQQTMVEKVLVETAKWTNVGVIAGELEDEKFLRDKDMTVSPANRQLFLERVVKRSTPEQLGARPGDYARLQALTN